jgi:uncharacterized protein (DUF885 family)
LFDREVAQDPETQTYLGLKTADQDKWSDRSDAAAQANVEEARADLQRLASFGRSLLSEDNRTSYDVLKYQLEETIDAALYRCHSYVVDQFRGQVTDKLSLLLNAHKIDSVQDAKDYITRVVGLENVYADMTKQLVDRAAFGVITPAFAYQDMINDISGLGTGAPIDQSGINHALLDDFTNKISALELDEQAKADLITSVSEAIRGPFKSAIDSLLAEITRQSTPAEGNKGVWALPGGEAFYNAQIKQNTP